MMRQSIRSSDAPVQIKQLGTLDYVAAWDLQRATADARVAGGPDTLLLLEHPPVYTAGRRTESHERPVDNIPVVDTDLGGKITWHGPGQLVGYPIVGLGEQLDVVNYVRRLEQSLIAVCSELGLDVGRVEGRSGVWLPSAAGRPARVASTSRCSCSSWPGSWSAYTASPARCARGGIAQDEADNTGDASAVRLSTMQLRGRR